MSSARGALAGRAGDPSGLPEDVAAWLDAHRDLPWSELADLARAALAHRDGVATARLIREAMERYVIERQREMEPLPLPDWVGMFEGDGEPFAERVDEILAEVADEVYRTEVLGKPKRRRA